jgi:hypothetical protein
MLILHINSHLHSTILDTSHHLQDITSLRHIRISLIIIHHHLRLLLDDSMLDVL